METDLNDIVAFIRVVESGSFSAAAKHLGVPTSTVSRRVARLEDRLGARLLQRTTRRLSLTDAGRIYHEHCTRVLIELENADRAVAHMQSTPRGKLRVTAPDDLPDRLWSLIAHFLAKYPDVEMHLHVTERFVDLIGEGFDVALRGGPRPDTSTLVARKINESERVLVASPDYLKRRGTPKTPNDLREHDCIVFTPWAPHSTWTLRGEHGNIQVPVHGRVTVNKLEVAERAALSGYGIAQLFRPSCAEQLDSGQLAEILPQSCLSAGALWIIYPSRTHLSPVVRAFVEHVVEYFDEYVNASG